ncbi:MAG: selenium-dependent xanthine dehydrogenase [Anaerolineales bacterium]|uniref:Selenium-dependent xanthine dehydrogenase n=1 Tax=Candidatus Desulfolinea nitratireducens TaxID=2841698 RepID=A0A8J6NP83_9CHLR|nr:selenium-dependent xanthine dehydrogenase [Candidatus Desulfolinea nitratireducens]MBL6961745.1 selenium-dependent xanthine dehydrogenase [Anaerolineales bacterium]
MKFFLNGQEKEFDGDPEVTLLTYLREHENITSVKDGCSGQASCGSCTVDIDGKSKLSCITPMKKIIDTNITTPDGLGEYRREVFANAFAEKGGAQCGFCTPGIVMRANTLLNRISSPTEDDIKQALTPHICRCTGYTKVIDSVIYAAEAIREEKEIASPTSDGRLGSRHPKYEAQKLVLGDHKYTDDIRIEGMMHGALKFSDYPRAKILGIDTRAAEELAGVLRIFTADDVPGDRVIGLISQDWPLMIAIGEITHYLGDVIAGVVAETEAIAREAVSKIKVEYEVLEVVSDMHKAMEPESPKVHESGNILAHPVYIRGDMEDAIAKSAYISKGIYETQRVEHAFMEVETAVAVPKDDGVEVYSQSQGIYEDRTQIAKILALPEEKVRVILVANGGGFGGKEDLSVQGHAALMAKLLGLPVKVHLTRDESIIMHPKRHPVWMDYTLGCDKEGKLTFIKARFVGDTGAYASVGAKVLTRIASHATAAYHVPATDIEAFAVYTNNLPCGAMRGFGVNQATFGMESSVDDLCEQGGFDRWQFRYDNALMDGSMTATGQILAGGVGVRKALEAIKDEFYKTKYAGIACGLKNTGIGNGMPDESSALITIAGPEKIIIDHGWTEMGQGVNTIAAQVVCNETGIHPDLIEIRVDTAAEQNAGMTTASRATSLLGNALLDACKKLNEDLKHNTLADLVGNKYFGEWIVDWTTKGDAKVDKVVTHYSYSYAAQLVSIDDDGQIDKVTAAHDAGKIFNPMLFEGQVEGAIHMGIGYAISEDLPMEGGYPLHTNFRKLGILRAKEMPPVEVIGVEVPDPLGPYGAKGVGEIGLVPTAAAVANALYQYDGERRTKFPMKLPKKKKQINVIKL